MGAGRFGSAPVLTFKALHILTMFAAVTFLVGEGLLYARAIWRRDVSGLASIRRLIGGRPILGVVFFVLGIVFGVLTPLTGGFDLLAGWLVGAYLLVVALFVVNGSPWVQRLPQIANEALAAEAGQRPVAEVVTAMEKMRTSVLVAVTLNVLLFAALIGDMVLKPF